MWYVLLVILSILLIAYVVNSFIYDRKMTKKKTVETIGNELWTEIEHEREEATKNGITFRKLLNRYKTKMK